MKVLLVWAVQCRLTGISVRYERYVRGLQAIGHDPITVCLPAAAEGYSEKVAIASNELTLQDPAFYKRFGADVAIILTWLGLPKVVKAAKAAGLWVVSIADSDGKVGVRAHPRATFNRMVRQHTQWGTRLRAAKYWAQLYLGGPGKQDLPILESTDFCDRVVVCSPVAANHLSQFFVSYNRQDLVNKVLSVPYPIDECYLSGEACGSRQNRVVAIGRWDDPQKDADLLCGATAQYLAAGGRAELLVFGPNGEKCFGPLASVYSRVRYLGVHSPAYIAEQLRQSRALVLTSRWESGPIAVYEALASGCTVITTDAVPAALSVCGEGFGTISTGRSAAQMATALQIEMKAWECGNRRPEEIAAYWRPRFAPATVCRELLSGYETRESS